MLSKNEYNYQDIQEILNFLVKKGTFNFPSLSNGLFSAAVLQEQTNYTGYDHVWIRDNVYVAYTHYLCGSTDVAIKNVITLKEYFKKHSFRFTDIINGQTNPDNVMARPHIRFIGETLSESAQEWQHAQNDALGYFLWFYCQLIIDKIVTVSEEDWQLLSLFPQYFQAINYWQDEDSGHWEEERKVSASSIGVVVAGLQMLQKLLEKNSISLSNELFNQELITKLITQGKTTLNSILPAECIQPSSKQRRYDAALIFLVYPLQVISQEMAQQIVQDIINNLQGEYGIRRYLGDSFWCRNYQEIPEAIRTSISSEREAWLTQRGKSLVEGEEAQWCIFDPILSIIFGLQYQKSQQANDLDKQIYYFNRSLSQITDEQEQSQSFKCPELYYLQNGTYIHNDSTPLLWTQANLRMAFEIMQRSLSLK